MTQELPLVSVVMPVRNEAGFIARNLEAVTSQDYPADRLEILVADGMSDDGTRDIVRGFMTSSGSRSGARVELVDNPERIMPTGTNAAIRRARGEVILLLGGHASLPSNYIRACVEELLRSDADCVGGAMVSVGDGPTGETIAAAMSSPFGIGNSGFRTGASGDEARPADTVPFGAFRRRVFERIGLFNPHMVRHQDYELNYRLRASGGRILLLPSLRAVYHVRPSLTGLARQYWQYGIWKGRFVRNYPDSLRPRHLAPALLVLALVAGAIAALFSPIGRVAFLILLAMYALFLLVATLAMRGRLAPDRLLRLPWVIVILHTSYGAGMWNGLRMAPVPPAPRL
ncbi:MAG TPA: glycosyltransferase family 2 protein [Candidatus Sulfotelmatobacter sp.]|nr:glycosyltransferase family 2 protein [Candidatus Sulfotelmatobacter sp.]